MDIVSGKETDFWTDPYKTGRPCRWLEILEVLIGIWESPERKGSAFWKWRSPKWVSNESELDKGEARALLQRRCELTEAIDACPPVPSVASGTRRCSGTNVPCSGLLGEAGAGSELPERFWSQLCTLESLQSYNVFVSSSSKACHF